jgi:hypothetical protein
VAFLHLQYVLNPIFRQQKINEIEKGELPEVIEIIRDPNDPQRVKLYLVNRTNQEDN